MSKPGLRVASEGTITWRCLPVCKYETICRQQAVWSFSFFWSFSGLHWANLSTVHASFVSSDPGAECKHCPQYVICVRLCVYSCWPLCAWAACLDWLPICTVWIYKFVFLILPCSLLSPPLHVCVCLYVCCLFNCKGDVYYWCMFVLAPTPGPPDQRKLPGHSWG